MRFARGVWLTLLLLMISAAVAQGQQSSKISTVNYGNIVITATNWPFLIAEQEGMFQKESFDFKRVIGGNTTATAQALVAGWPVMITVRGNVVMEWPENESRAKVTDASVGQYLRCQLARSV
jgi:ABC-type nitrate/sulfonate/bicarbonate transport system substrate-binding protein